MGDINAHERGLLHIHESCGSGLWNRHLCTRWQFLRRTAVLSVSGQDHSCWQTMVTCHFGNKTLWKKWKQMLEINHDKYIEQELHFFVLLATTAIVRRTGCQTCLTHWPYGSCSFLYHELPLCISFQVWIWMALALRRQVRKLNLSCPDDDLALKVRK